MPKLEEILENKEHLSLDFRAESENILVKKQS